MKLELRYIVSRKYSPNGVFAAYLRKGHEQGRTVWHGELNMTTYPDRCVKTYDELTDRQKAIVDQEPLPEKWGEIKKEEP